MRRFNLAFTLMATFAIAICGGRSSSAQSLTTLASFSGTNGEGPQGSVTLIGSTLYGMTEYGGATFQGNVFSIPANGGSLTNLASFNGTDGKMPLGSLTASTDGSTLYGMTYEGGSGGEGTVFSLPVTGGTPNTLVAMNGPNGALPVGALTLSGASLYGMSEYGGPVNTYGDIFSVPAAGGPSTTLLNFDHATNGEFPTGNLTLSADGSTFYGIADTTIFSIPVGGGSPTILGSPGAAAYGSLTLSPNGTTLYGMTYNGGAFNDGSVFSIPVGGGPLTTLLSLNASTGDFPYYGSLTIVGSRLFAMTGLGGAHGDGSILDMPLGSGPATSVFSFNGTNGSDPYGSLTLSADGSTLYGMTAGGGTSNLGTVFAYVTPEPSSIVTLGLGVIGFGAMALRKKLHRRSA